MNTLKKGVKQKSKFTKPLKACLLLSVPFFIFSLDPAKAEQTSNSSLSLPTLQLAAAPTRYNFNRARYSTQRYHFKKKKKKRYRTSKKRKSWRKQLAKLKTWDVDENNKDPIQLVVSTRNQNITVYKGAQRVATSKISSGKKGHATPTGVFSILGKRRFHHSNIYSRAPMPYMQRLTWSGIALHASNSVPNYPASHGCVRLPNSFAPKLFKFTERGAHVIIADEAPRIVSLSSLNLLKPLTPNMRASEIAKIKAELLAKEMKARKEQQEKEAAKLAKKPAPKKAEGAEAQKAEVEKPEIPKIEVKLSDSPIRILITRRLGRERVRDVQDMLRELGHEPGESDGYMGKDTGKAILAFQKSQGLKETGAFSDELESALYKTARKKSAPTGYLYVRQGFKNLLSTPISIKDPQKPLGTHLITAQHFTVADRNIRWRAMTLKDKVPEFLTKKEDGQKEAEAKPENKPIQVAQAGNAVIATSSPKAAAPAQTPAPTKEELKKAEELKKQEMEKKLDAAQRENIQKTLARVQIPVSVATRLSLLLTPGSSIAISDKGLSKETTPHGTDFILLTR